MEHPFFSWSSHKLFLGTFFDGEFTTVVAAFGANMVVHDLCAAVAASSQLRFFQRIVRSSLGRTGLRESVFWMWHIIIFFVYLFQSFQCIPAWVGIIAVVLLLAVGKELYHVGVTLSFGV